MTPSQLVLVPSWWSLLPVPPLRRFPLTEVLSKLLDVFGGVAPHDQLPSARRLARCLERLVAVRVLLPGQPADGLNVHLEPLRHVPRGQQIRWQGLLQPGRRCLA